MTAPKYALERDANHAELEDAARRMGAYVVDSSSFSQYHEGFPDNIWALWWIGQTWMVEFKVGDAKLSEAQEKFREEWLAAGGVHVTVRSVDDVERLLKR